MTTATTLNLTVNVTDRVSVEDCFAKLREAFEALLPVNITVEDKDGLDSLPIGTLIRDQDGDVCEKVEFNLYRYVTGSAVVGGYEDTAGGIVEYLPGVIENPDILDLPAPELPTLPNSAMLGAYVNDTDGFDALPSGSIVAQADAEWVLYRKMIDCDGETDWHTFADIAVYRRPPAIANGYIVTFVGSGV